MGLTDSYFYLVVKFLLTRTFSVGEMGPQVVKWLYSNLKNLWGATNTGNNLNDPNMSIQEKHSKWISY